MRGEGSVAGEGRVVGVPKFHSWGKCAMPLTNIRLRLDVQRFPWLYYIVLFMWVLYFASWGVITSTTSSAHGNLLAYNFILQFDTTIQVL